MAKLEKVAFLDCINIDEGDEWAVVPGIQSGQPPAEEIPPQNSKS